MLTLSKRKRGGPNKVYAVWAPGATGKTMVAVNLACMLAEKGPTALVDLSPDGAAHTWLNCSGAGGLKELLDGSADGAFTPVCAPNLSVFTAPPGEKPLYNGEASLLSNAVKALEGYHIIFDTPSSYVRASNILTLADSTVIVTDFNIHNTLMLPKYLKTIKNPVFVINRHSDSYPANANPAEILEMKPAAVVPDMPHKIYQGILTGSPVGREHLESIIKDGEDLAE